MRKIAVSISVMVIIILELVGFAFAAGTSGIVEVPDIKIIMEGKMVDYENVPISVRNNTLLPLRELATILGVPNDDEHIIYSHTDKSVTLLHKETKIVIYINKLKATVNDVPVKLNISPIIYGKDQLSYIPFRFVAEALGNKVIWDGSADAILICDAVKFDSIKKILDKSTEETNKVNKFIMEMDVSAKIESETISTKMGITAKSSVDVTNKKMEMQMLMDIIGMQIKTNTYYADRVSYTLEPFTGTWQKQTYLQPEYDLLFENQSNTDFFESSEALSAGLNQVQSTNDNEILLKGDIYLNEVFKNALSQQSLQEDQDFDEDLDFQAFSIEISMDKSTYLINRILMKVKIDQTDAELLTAMDITITVLYSEYNGSFEIIIPEEVVKSAVEAKTKQQLN